MFQIKPRLEHLRKQHFQEAAVSCYDLQIDAILAIFYPLAGISSLTRYKDQHYFAPKHHCLALV